MRSKIFHCLMVLVIFLFGMAFGVSLQEDQLEPQNSVTTQIFIKEVGQDQIDTCSLKLKKTKQELTQCEAGREFYQQYNDRILTEIRICEKFGDLY